MQRIIEVNLLQNTRKTNETFLTNHKLNKFLSITQLLEKRARTTMKQVNEANLSRTKALVWAAMLRRKALCPWLKGGGDRPPGRLSSVNCMTVTQCFNCRERNGKQSQTNPLGCALLLSSILNLLILCHFHFEWTSRDMLISPLDQQNMVATILHYVIYLIVMVANMLNEHFFARVLGTNHTHVQDVFTCLLSAYGKGVLLIHWYKWKWGDGFSAGLIPSCNKYNYCGRL